MWTRLQRRNGSCPKKKSDGSQTTNQRPAQRNGGSFILNILINVLRVQHHFFLSFSHGTNNDKWKFDLKLCKLLLGWKQVDKDTMPEEPQQRWNAKHKANLRLPLSTISFIFIRRKQFYFVYSFVLLISQQVTLRTSGNWILFSFSFLFSFSKYNSIFK